MMTKMLILISVCALLIVFLATLKRGKDKPETGELNIRATPILSDNEREFFYRLVRALPNYHIFPQVSFAAILQPGYTKSHKERLSNLGKFNQKRADFVICAHETLKVLAVIELDDSTHVADKDKKRDIILTSAGYRILRFSSKKKPSELEIAGHFEAKAPNIF